MLAVALLFFGLVQAVTLFCWMRKRERTVPARRALADLRATTEPGSKEVMDLLEAIVERVLTRRELALHVAPVTNPETLVVFLHTLAGVLALHYEESMELQKELRARER